jgi:ribosomal protein L40E
LGIALVIALVIEFRYLRPKKDDAIEKALDRDDAYNAMTTAQAVSNALRDKGRDTKEADRLLVEAELAYNRGDYLKCTDASKRAKDYLAIAPMAKPDFTPLSEDKPEPTDQPLPEQPKISEVKKLPPNYVESKFMITTAADHIEKGRSEGRDVTASVCLLDEAKMAFDCKDYDTAFRKSLKAKKAAEGTAEPATERIVEVAMPVKADQVIKSVDQGASPDIPATVSCAKCGAEARADDSFCAKCGTPIVSRRLCSQCGADLSLDDLFCRKCGTEAVTENK